jgi:protein-S-isoprenylcysteine O-methyltransferase Ste14
MALQQQFERQGHNLISSASAVPLLVLVLGYIFLGAVETYPENYFLQKSIYEEIYELACLLLSLSGFMIVLYTNGYPDNTSLYGKLQLDAPTRFTTSGAYSVLRHPVYYGTIIMWLGPALVTGNLFFIISFVLFCCIFFERMMLAEERYLKKAFGPKYSRWAQNVPVVIPRLLNFKKPVTAFSWKRAYKKSTGRLALVLTAFFLFDLMTEVIAVEPNYNHLYLSMLLIAIAGTAGIEIQNWIQTVRDKKKKSL